MAPGAGGLIWQRAGTKKRRAMGRPGAEEPTARERGESLAATPSNGSQQQNGDKQSARAQGGSGGVSAQELPTALGTVVRFERDGVAYTVVGSVPPAKAEAAARGL